jgi:hypothetical protein
MIASASTANQASSGQLIVMVCYIVIPWQMVGEKAAHTRHDSVDARYLSSLAKK